jgi:hypothetical protein
MNNLEKMLELYENGRPDTLFKVMLARDCAGCTAAKYCAGSCGCSEARARWLLEEYSEPDSWEKIEADAKKGMSQYWGCTSKSCYDCPAVIDGLKPHERYNTGSNCDTAKACELVARCKKLAVVE